MKAVLDTNVLISAMGWNGRERNLLLKAASGEFELVLSDEIIKELLGVLQRPKFEGLDTKMVLHFMDILMEISTVVVPKKRHKTIKADPDDNMILDCAVESNAGYIISGDKDLLGLKEFKGIRVIRPAEFEKILSRK